MLIRTIRSRAALRVGPLVQTFYLSFKSGCFTSYASTSTFFSPEVNVCSSSISWRFRRCLSSESGIPAETKSPEATSAASATDTASDTPPSDQPAAPPVEVAPRGLFRRTDGGASLEDVVIVGYGRTPIGSFRGGLSGFQAWQLGGVAIKGALERANVKPEAVESLIMGNVLSAGLGQAPAKQAALAAGLPPSTVCTLVNKVCSSGMKAVMLGAQEIALGLHQVVVAGGMESMSNAPYLLERGAGGGGKKLGALAMKDHLEWDGLWDPVKESSMGSFAETVAGEMRFSRDDQDGFAIESYERAIKAEATGILATEITPVELPSGGGKKKKDVAPTFISEDEEPKRFDPDKMSTLRGAFVDEGTVTAGNASSISDGAAALVLTSGSYATEHGLTILAHIAGFGDAEQVSDRFPTSPSLAIPRALKSAQLSLKDVDLFEINEAFSVVVLANAQLLGIDHDDINVHGGSVALGHPIGSSGARIIISLLTALAVKGTNIGVAAVCNGGGGASALVLERAPEFRLYSHRVGIDGKRRHSVEKPEGEHGEGGEGSP